MSVAEQSIAGAEARGHGFMASSVGRKVVMAATGIVLFGFVTVHMIGNTQAYMGAEAFNGYAKFLHSMLHGGGIWIFRAVLLTGVGWSSGRPACAWTTGTPDPSATGAAEPAASSATASAWPTSRSTSWTRWPSKTPRWPNNRPPPPRRCKSRPSA